MSSCLELLLDFPKSRTRTATNIMKSKSKHVCPVRTGRVTQCSRTNSLPEGWMFASYPSSGLKKGKVNGLTPTDDWCSQQARAPSQQTALCTDSSHVWGCRTGLITGPETHQRHPPLYLWASSKLPAKETLLQTSTLSDCFVIENSCSCWEAAAGVVKRMGKKPFITFLPVQNRKLRSQGK